ncbi:MAG TPA: dihydroorotase [Candidatus Binataceae bacterium]|nr:dihydroorotase [Candidatus Binataceae bacterium]
MLRGGRVIDPGNELDGVLDLRIVDGVIDALERPGVMPKAAGVAEVDVGGCWVVPGLIDVHVHLRDPGFPQKETIVSGLRAAAAGGFTAVAAMANTSPVNDSPEVTRYMLAQARNARAATLIPVSAVSVGLEGTTPVDYQSMVRAGARLFSDDGMPIDDQSLMARALDEITGLGFTISLHEEDRALSGQGAANAGEISKRLGVAGVPIKAESKRVRRDLALAIGAGKPLHLAHVSAAESISLVRAARSRGAQITCEVTPHHFTLDESAVLQCGPDAKMNPPLRSKQDVAVLQEAMTDGTIDMIATDHAPHDAVSKEMKSLAQCFGVNPERHLGEDEARAMTRAANGIVGLETAVGLALELVHRAVIGPARMIEMMALNPARLLRLDARSLSIGRAADITVIDPERRWRVDPGRFVSLSHNTPFAGRELKGKAIMTIVAGEIVYDAGNERVQ